MSSSNLRKFSEITNSLENLKNEAKKWGREQDREILHNLTDLGKVSLENIFDLSKQVNDQTNDIEALNIKVNNTLNGMKLIGNAKYVENVINKEEESQQPKDNLKSSERTNKEAVLKECFVKNLNEYDRNYLSNSNEGLAGGRKRVGFDDKIPQPLCPEAVTDSSIYDSLPMSIPKESAFTSVTTFGDSFSRSSLESVSENQRTSHTEIPKSKYTQATNKDQNKKEVVVDKKEIFSIDQEDIFTLDKSTPKTAAEKPPSSTKTSQTAAKQSNERASQPLSAFTKKINSLFDTSSGEETENAPSSRPEPHPQKMAQPVDVNTTSKSQQTAPPPSNTTKTPTLSSSIGHAQPPNNVRKVSELNKHKKRSLFESSSGESDDSSMSLEKSSQNQLENDKAAEPVVDNKVEKAADSFKKQLNPPNNRTTPDGHQNKATETQKEQVANKVAAIKKSIFESDSDEDDIFGQTKSTAQPNKEVENSGNTKSPPRQSLQSNNNTSSSKKSGVDIDKFFSELDHEKDLSVSGSSKGKSVRTAIDEPYDSIARPFFNKDLNSQEDKSVKLSEEKFDISEGSFNLRGSNDRIDKDSKNLSKTVLKSDMFIPPADQYSTQPASLVTSTASSNDDSLKKASKTGSSVPKTTYESDSVPSPQKMRAAPLETSPQKEDTRSKSPSTPTAQTPESSIHPEDKNQTQPDTGSITTESSPQKEITRSKSPAVPTTHTPKSSIHSGDKKHTHPVTGSTTTESSPQKESTRSKSPAVPTTHTPKSSIHSGDKKHAHPVAGPTSVKTSPQKDDTRSKSPATPIAHTLKSSVPSGDKKHTHPVTGSTTTEVSPQKETIPSKSQVSPTGHSPKFPIPKAETKDAPSIVVTSPSQDKIMENTQQVEEKKEKTPVPEDATTEAKVARNASSKISGLANKLGNLDIAATLGANRKSPTFRRHQSTKRNSPSEPSKEGAHEKEDESTNDESHKLTGANKDRMRIRSKSRPPTSAFVKSMYATTNDDFSLTNAPQYGDSSNANDTTSSKVTTPSVFTDDSVKINEPQQESISLPNNTDKPPIVETLQESEVRESVPSPVTSTAGEEYLSAQEECDPLKSSRASSSESHTEIYNNAVSKEENKSVD